MMLRILVLLAAITAACTAVTAWVVSAPRPAFAEADALRFEGGDAARGKQVFNAGQCASCHASPGQADRLRLGGGLALDRLSEPFTHPTSRLIRRTGLGFGVALISRTPSWQGCRRMVGITTPSLPYASYAHMRAEDVRDLIAYLRTLPPVRGRAPPHQLPFPLIIRRGVGFWKLLYLDRTPILDDPSRDAAWNRGRYLTEALSHCAECHSTRDLLNAIKPSTRFAGGPDQEGAGFVPNITPRAIGAWSEDELFTVLTTGRTADLRIVGSSMADVVSNMAALPASDRRAIATYVRSLPPRPTPGLQN